MILNKSLYKIKINQIIIKSNNYYLFLGYVDDIYGYDFGSNDNDPMDNIWHGTHVAGIIAA